ncbi:MAG: tetratricopeptide repeat protein [Deltaproteobacteria bacterium]|nr:tetratricopeptide repeat protein [Deltaproteobacteria bacterium]MBW1949757.1 tetratricopeptide repeat protein [Deltaproteobacteria bacterium]MBW2008930.1 tetratricopeptide repeat protein [Deltaproteobacteria bacterium]MBW2102818.1 tetratricopeptide repeat protein [Deltaproteobacteria bacterium]
MNVTPASQKLIASLLLLALTLIVFRQVGHHEFINYDDPLLITENRHIAEGLTWDGVRWAFTTHHALNWHPLTWISHMLDVELFRFQPGAHHLSSLILHMANTLLLFLALHRMTGTLWRAGFVAAFFAVHPLHVESVAWAAERKDVLSTFFWMAATLAYARYAERPGGPAYLLVMVLFIMGLLSKPMVVTLPFVFMLLDYWPLRRLNGSHAGSGPIFRLILEKIPLLALSAASSVVTIWAQRSWGAIIPFDTLPLTARIQNAVLSYATYVAKTLWPSGLAVFYPHPRRIPWTDVTTAALFLAMISLGVAALRKNRGYLPVGWLWFLGTLVPVIGLIQVGSQAMADRYTYIPLIGIFIIGVWGLYDLTGLALRGRVIPKAVLGAAVVALAVTASVQVSYWRDSVTLYRHALEMTEQNGVAHYNLGVALERLGDTGRAMEHYREALRINPRNDMALNNLGRVLAGQGRYGDAVSCLKKALVLRPANVRARTNLGVVLSRVGQLREALREHAEAVRLDPRFVTARYNYGLLLGRFERYAEAATQFREAVRLAPQRPIFRYYLGLMCLKTGDSGCARKAVDTLRSQAPDLALKLEEQILGPEAPSS